MSATSELDISTGKFRVTMYDELRGQRRTVKICDSPEEAEQLIKELTSRYYHVNTRKASGPPHGKRKEWEMNKAWKERAKASHQSIISKLKGVRYT